jgi:hypothetical protein
VYEAPFDISPEVSDTIFKNFREGIGWQPMSPFSDPLGTLTTLSGADQATKLKAAMAAADNQVDLVIDYWRNITPAYTPDALEELFLNGASLPNVYNLDGQNRNRKNRDEANKASRKGGSSGGIAGTGGGDGGGQWFPGQRPGQTDSEYAAEHNPPPSGEGSNYGVGAAPVKFPGYVMGPGSDDQHDLSYTKKVDDSTWVDNSGTRYDDHGRIK